ncbi:MAG TPA: WYL domain-containing protein [Methylocella sp.]|nr:WYL domain-containing protein [Methylocella sp.]
MRSEKPAELLRLALELAAHAEGLTTEEMMAFCGVQRRTIERRRAAIEQILGPLDRIEDGRLIRFRLSGRSIGSFATAPTPEELAELEKAARAHEMARDPKRAEILRSLNRKIQASLRASERNRLAPDIEALLRSEAIARQVGPRPFGDASLLSKLRQALLSERMVSFLYGDCEAGTARRRKVIPYGLLFAARYYLVGCSPGKPAPVLFRLSRMSHLELLEETGRPPADFDLAAYTARSFGVFQEEPETIILRFDAEVAEDARAFLFHPTQLFSDEPDGALIVRFTAGGLLEIARHLMSWSGKVTIFAPDRLKEILWQEVQALHRRYQLDPRGRNTAHEPVG